MRIRSCRTLAALCAFTAGSAVPVEAATAPDATLFTTYSVYADLKSIIWVVCGSTAEDEGCYSSGSIRSFGRIGAMLESAPITSGDTVNRKLYVLDVASGSGADGVTLFVYNKKDVVTTGYDTTTITLDQTILLPLVGGKTVTASMAANNAYLFVGINQSTLAVMVDKHDWTVTAVGGFAPPINVAEITADRYGYVTVTYGTPGGESSGYYVFGPTGGLQMDGGGTQFMLDDINAVIPARLR
jgi:hypothetical protein